MITPVSFSNALLTQQMRWSQFRRMAARSGIEHRYSCLELIRDWETGSTLNVEGLYTRGKFANTAARMEAFEAHAPELAVTTIVRAISRGYAELQPPLR